MNEDDQFFCDTLKQYCDDMCTLVEDYSNLKNKETLTDDEKEELYNIKTTLIEIEDAIYNLFTAKEFLTPF